MATRVVEGVEEDEMAGEPEDGEAGSLRRLPQFQCLRQIKHEPGYRGGEEWPTSRPRACRARAAATRSWKA